jgi:hypothetical protein
MGSSYIYLSQYICTSGIPPVTMLFLSNALQEIAEAPGQKIWCGDYNFIHTPDLDCISVTHVADHTVSTHFDAVCPHLTNTYRRLYPRTCKFSRVGNGAAARLARIIVTQNLVPYVMKASVESGYPSDHRMAITRISPASPSKVGPGL